MTWEGVPKRDAKPHLHGSRRSRVVGCKGRGSGRCDADDKVSLVIRQVNVKSKTDLPNGSDEIFAWTHRKSNILMNQRPHLHQPIFTILPVILTIPHLLAPVSLLALNVT